MTIQTARYPVSAPAVTKSLGTLLDTATVTSEFAWLDGNDLFQSYNCMKFEHGAEFCAPNTKDFDQSASWVDGFRFAVYGGVTCKAVGLDATEMKAEVSRVFESGESTGVERALMATRFAADPGDRWEAATDITPSSGAVKPAVGIALLEGYSANNYVGTPTLHVPRVVASLLLGLQGTVFEGNVLQTRLGSKVVAGSGYDYPNLGPDGSPAATGEKWLYSTGEVWIGQSDLALIDVMANEANTATVMAERGYIVAVDCFTAAVRVQVTA